VTTSTGPRPSISTSPTGPICTPPCGSPSSPPLPPGGAAVIFTILEQENRSGPDRCHGLNWCYFYTYDYVISLDPPAQWSGFTGTCRLLVQPASSAASTRSMTSCGQTNVAVGTGDGQDATFTVQACAASCVDSRSETYFLRSPWEYDCGEFQCVPVDA
jgi:hypothetical protein